MAARSGMIDMIEVLRGLVDAGTADFTIGTTTYWNDNTLQDLLDKYRDDFIEEELIPIQQYRNGTVYYQDYRSQYGNLEGVASGTAIFKLDNSGGTNMPGTMWTADYPRGVITFTNDTLGSSMMLTGRSYDLNAAAAETWRYKLANAAKMYTFSAGGQSFQRKEYTENCKYMAEYYEGLAAPTIVSLYRGDNVQAGVNDD